MIRKPIEWGGEKWLLQRTVSRKGYFVGEPVLTEEQIEAFGRYFHFLSIWLLVDRVVARCLRTFLFSQSITAQARCFVQAIA